jgi:hypothetical protein
MLHKWPSRGVRVVGAVKERATDDEPQTGQCCREIKRGVYLRDTGLRTP